MIAKTVDECGSCARLYFPGDEIYPSRQFGMICDGCYRKSIRFYRLILAS